MLQVHIFNLYKMQITCFVILLTIICFVNGNTLANEEVIEKLLTHYNSKARPPGTNSSIKPDGGPVIVSVNMYLRRLEVNDEEHEHTAQITFRQFWTDERLAYKNFQNGNQRVPPYVVSSTELNKPIRIWTPDTFLQNEVEDTNTDSDRPNSLIRISKDGQVLFSKKFTATFYCNMTARAYPFDKQACAIEIASYGYTTADILYVWKENSKSSVNFKGGIENQYASGFTVVDHQIMNCTQSTSTGDYSCIRLVLQFKRAATMDTHKVFHYSYVIVFASWVSFWLEPVDVAARSFIGVACLMATIFFNHLITDGTLAEIVPYSNALRVWTEATLAFVFLAFVQLVFVILLTSVQRAVKTRGYDLQLRDMLTNDAEDGSEHQWRSDGSRTRWARILDIICRILFPVAYAIFNIIFWTTMVIE